MVDVSPHGTVYLEAPSLDDCVNALKTRVSRMAAYYARCANADADDLLQEAWLGLLEGQRDLNPRVGSSEQYLIRRARWRMLDALKKVRRNRCISFDTPAAEPAALESSDFNACTEEFLDHLDITQREVLTCLLGGLTWREAGKRLCCSSANIAYHVQKIRERYRHWIAED